MLMFSHLGIEDKRLVLLIENDLVDVPSPLDQNGLLSYIIVESFRPDFLPFRSFVRKAAGSSESVGLRCLNHRSDPTRQPLMLSCPELAASASRLLGDDLLCLGLQYPGRLSHSSRRGSGELQRQRPRRGWAP